MPLRPINERRYQPRPTRDTMFRSTPALLPPGPHPRYSEPWLL